MRQMRATRLILVSLSILLYGSAILAAADSPPLTAPRRFRGETYLLQCFNSEEDFWLDMHDSSNNFSASVVNYYARQPAVEQSVTGDIDEEIADADVLGTSEFIRDLVSAIPPPRIALDCGAGVGRVAVRALAPYFDTIDMVEPIEAFAVVAQKRLGARCGNVTIAPVQNVTFSEGKYDLVVMNWLLLYLTHVQVVDVLKKARDSLRPGGYIFVKDNVPRRMWYYADEPTLGMHRTSRHLQHLFQLAGLVEARASQLQTSWPDGLLKLRMFVLKRSPVG